MIMKPSVFDRALLWGLVLTLPLTPIKLVWGQYSLYVLFSLVLIVRVLGRALLGDRTIWRSVNRLDGLLFIYFGVVIFGVAVNYKDGAILILGKTLFYFAGYFSLKVQLNGMAAPAITDLLRKGCWAGLTLYLALMLYAMVVFDVSLEFSQYSYNNFALKIFKPMVSVVSGQEDLESRDIMRNTLGEIFALYGVILLLTAKSARLKGLWGVFVATSLVLLTFSRRAFIQVAITCLLVVAGRREPFMRILIAVVLFSTVTIFVLLFEPALGVDVRVLQLIDQSRIEQFLAVLAPINDSLFIGQGYGACRNVFGVCRSAYPDFRDRARSASGRRHRLGVVVAWIHPEQPADRRRVRMERAQPLCRLLSFCRPSRGQPACRRFITTGGLLAGSAARRPDPWQSLSIGRLVSALDALLRGQLGLERLAIPR